MLTLVHVTKAKQPDPRSPRLSSLRTTTTNTGLPQKTRYKPCTRWPQGVQSCATCSQCLRGCSRPATMQQLFTCAGPIGEILANLVQANLMCVISQVHLLLSSNHDAHPRKC